VDPFTLVAPWSAPWTYSTFKLSWHSQFLEWKFLLVHSFIHSFKSRHFPQTFVASIKMHYKMQKNVRCPCVKDAIWPLVWFVCPQSFPLLSRLHSTYGLWWLPHDFTHFWPPMWFVFHQSLPGRLHFAPFPSTNFHTNFVVVQSCNWQLREQSCWLLLLRQRPKDFGLPCGQHDDFQILW